MTQILRTLEQQLEEHTDPLLGVDACWPYNEGGAYTTTVGYDSVSNADGMVVYRRRAGPLPHRAAYMVRNQCNLTSSDVVLRTCDGDKFNTCVNPSHLYVVTRKEVLQYKLTDEHVAYIRNNPDYPEQHAAMFNVTKKYIQRIINGKARVP